MVIGSELKAVMFMGIDEQIYEVLEVQSKAGAAKLGGVMKTKLRNVNGGRIWEQHFRPDERLEVQQQTLEFLSSDADYCTFMNPETFRANRYPRDNLRDSGAVPAARDAAIPAILRRSPISAVLPEIVEARVASTAPPVHAQQDSTWKEAHSKTVCTFECRCSFHPAKRCTSKSRPVAMWNRQEVSAKGVRKTWFSQSQLQRSEEY